MLGPRKAPPLEEEKKSQKIQIYLSNISLYLNQKQLYKYFVENLPQIEISGIKKQVGKPFGYVEFESEEDLEKFKAHSKINPLSQQMSIKSVKHKITGLHSFAKMKKEQQAKKMELTEEEIEKILSEPIAARISPLMHQSYGAQIAIKRTELQRIFKSDMIGRFTRECTKEKNELKWVKEANDSELFKFSEILECPEPYRQGFRNKNELTIGINYKTKNVEIGINRGISGWLDGEQYVQFPSVNSNVSLATFKIAETIQSLIRKTTFKPYNTVTHLGLWRTLLIKESHRTHQVQVILGLSKNYVDSLLEEARQQYKQILTDIETQVMGLKQSQEEKAPPLVTSLYYAYCDSLSGAFTPGSDVFELRAGDPCYSEIVNGFKFEVSPQAFFQVNTPVFQEVLNMLQKWAQIDEDTVILDICCGTGVIGICLSKKAKQIIGIELIEEAIQDAKKNAMLNDIQDKCEFYAGRAEMTLQKIIEPLKSHNLKIVGIVDPPRMGLHRDVIQAIRCCRGLDRVLYVSCNPNSLADNLYGLCMPAKKSRRGPCFVPRQFMGADFFPGSRHVETLCLLERSTLFEDYF